MKQTSTYFKVSVSALLLATSFVPAMALADDDAPAIAGARIQVGSDVSATGGAQGGLRVRNENDVDLERDGGPEDAPGDVRQDGDNRPDGRAMPPQAQGEEMRVEHSDVFASTTASTTIDRPQMVRNHGQLRSFLEHLVKADNRIAEVHVSSTSVATSYALPAKFLGAIPTNLTANVAVNSNGTVTVTYPWYAFLFAKHGDELKTQLEQVAASTTASGSTTLSASVQAQLLNTLFATLKTSAQ